jgi:hypothetical protein
MSAGLSDPVEVTVTSRLSEEEAAARLRDALEHSVSIESAATRTDRRLVGSMAGNRVVLSIRDQRVETRRKSWNIEFKGTLDPERSGSELRGSVEIPDRGALRVTMWLFRLAAVVPAVLAIGYAAGQSWDLATVAGPILLAVAIVTVVVLATARMERDGETQAANDAEALTAFLRHLLLA